MAKIKSIKGRQVFDSRGNPTVEAEVFLENNISATAISPSGASTGAFEAHELRDQDKNKFLGQSVNIAIENINNKISKALQNKDSTNQSEIDKILITLLLLSPSNLFYQLQCLLLPSFYTLNNCIYKDLLSLWLSSLQFQSDHNDNSIFP